MWRKLGSLGPGVGQQRNSFSAGAGAALGAYHGRHAGAGPLGGAVGAVGVPALGYVAQKAAERGTLNRASLSRALAASGSGVQR